MKKISKTVTGGVAVLAALLVAGSMLFQRRKEENASFSRFDLRIASTENLSSKDLQAVKNCKAVEAVEAVWEESVSVSRIPGKARFRSLSQRLDSLVLLEGRMPELPSEVIISRLFSQAHQVALGQTLTLSGNHLEGDYTVVGIASNESSGDVSGYLSTEAFQGSFQAMYVFAAASQNEQEDDALYNLLLEKVADQIEAIRPVQEQLREDSLKKELQEEMIQWQNLSDVKLNPVWEELEKAREELEEPKQELEDAKKKLDGSRLSLREFDRQLSDAKDSLDAGEEQLNAAKAQLDSAKCELEAAQAAITAERQALEQSKAEYQAALTASGVSEGELSGFSAQLDSHLTALDSTISEIQFGVNELNMRISEAEGMLSALQSSCAELAGNTKPGLIANAAAVAKLISIKQSISQTNAVIGQLETQRSTLNQNLSAAQAQRSALAEQKDSVDRLISAGSSLREGEAALIRAEKDYSEGLSTYNANELEYQQNDAAFQAAKEEYNAGYASYSKNLEQYQVKEREWNTANQEFCEKYDEYLSALEDYEAQRQKYADKIDAVQEKLAHLTAPQWTVEVNFK